MSAPVGHRRGRRERSRAWTVAALAATSLVLASCVPQGTGRTNEPTATTAAPDASPGVAFDGFGETALRITPPGREPATHCVLEAREPAQRRQGLMEVTDLGGYAGMAFLYPEETSGSFWMRNTPMPLTIAWVDSLGAVIGTTDMAPCGDSPDCPRYPPPAPYRTAVEVPQGEHTALGLVPGATVVVGGSCPARG